ncbi:MAG: L-histidine N(alpha)-methyltransferase [Candidatus Kapaibacteriales bacterium]
MIDEPNRLESEKSSETDAGFSRDVYEGLTAERKYLNSKYIYDKKGSLLFQEIMKLPEYYLTGCEYEILQNHSYDICEAIDATSGSMLIAEFGAGDGLKTKLLLKKMAELKAKFAYMPIDISKDALLKLLENISIEMPHLHTKPVNMDYFKALDSLKEDGRKKIVLFMGSNIGNFLSDDSHSFLSKIYEKLNPGDYFLMGADLKKDPRLIRKAYNDQHGVTERFNKNLLHRINRELGGDFDTMAFSHYESYDPVEGICRSYLISSKKQSVRIDKLGLEVDFEYAEPIHTEISRKFTTTELEEMAENSGFAVCEHFFDCKSYFVDTLWKKV